MASEKLYRNTLTRFLILGKIQDDGQDVSGGSIHPPTLPHLYQGGGMNLRVRTRVKIYSYYAFSKGEVPQIDHSQTFNYVPIGRFNSGNVFYFQEISADLNMSIIRRSFPRYKATRLHFSCLVVQLANAFCNIPGRMNIERLAVAISEAFLVTLKLVSNSRRIHDLTNQRMVCHPD